MHSLVLYQNERSLSVLDFKTLFLDCQENFAARPAVAWKPFQSYQVRRLGSPIREACPQFQQYRQFALPQPFPRPDLRPVAYTSARSALGRERPRADRSDSYPLDDFRRLVCLAIRAGNVQNPDKLLGGVG
jgi:hypothetical protein